MFCKVAPGRWWRLSALACSYLWLAGCVSTVVGAAVGTTVAVGAAVITAPIKVGGAVVDVVMDDEDD